MIAAGPNWPGFAQTGPALSSFRLESTSQKINFSPVLVNRLILASFYVVFPFLLVYLVFSDDLGAILHRAPSHLQQKSILAAFSTRLTPSSRLLCMTGLWQLCLRNSALAYPRGISFRLISTQFDT